MHGEVEGSRGENVPETQEKPGHSRRGVNCGEKGKVGSMHEKSATGFVGHLDW